MVQQVVGHVVVGAGAMGSELVCRLRQSIASVAPELLEIHRLIQVLHVGDGVGQSAHPAPGVQAVLDPEDLGKAVTAAIEKLSAAYSTQVPEPQAVSPTLYQHGLGHLLHVVVMPVFSLLEVPPMEALRKRLLEPLVAETSRWQRRVQVTVVPVVWLSRWEGDLPQDREAVRKATREFHELLVALERLPRDAGSKLFGSVFVMDRFNRNIHQVQPRSLAIRYTCKLLETLLTAPRFRDEPGELLTLYGRSSRADGPDGVQYAAYAVKAVRVPVREAVEDCISRSFGRLSDQVVGAGDKPVKPRESPDVSWLTSPLEHLTVRPAGHAILPPAVAHPVVIHRSPLHPFLLFGGIASRADGVIDILDAPADKAHALSGFVEGFIAGFEAWASPYLDARNCRDRLKEKARDYVDSTLAKMRGQVGTLLFGSGQPGTFQPGGFRRALEVLDAAVGELDAELRRLCDHRHRQWPARLQRSELRDCWAGLRATTDQAAEKLRELPPPKAMRRWNILVTIGVLGLLCCWAVLLRRELPFEPEAAFGTLVLTLVTYRVRARRLLLWRVSAQKLVSSIGARAQEIRERFRERIERFYESLHIIWKVRSLEQLRRSLEHDRALLRDLRDRLAGLASQHRAKPRPLQVSSDLITEVVGAGEVSALCDAAEEGLPAGRGHDALPAALARASSTILDGRWENSVFPGDLDHLLMETRRLLQRGFSLDEGYFTGYDRIVRDLLQTDVRFDLPGEVAAFWASTVTPECRLVPYLADSYTTGKVRVFRGSTFPRILWECPAGCGCSGRNGSAIAGLCLSRHEAVSHQKLWPDIEALHLRDDELLLWRVEGPLTGEELQRGLA